MTRKQSAPPPMGSGNGAQGVISRDAECNPKSTASGDTTQADTAVSRTCTPKRHADGHAAKLRRVLLELLDEHIRDDALPTNQRFLFYELVSRGILPKGYDNKRRTPAQELSEALTDLRKNGEVPWHYIDDETRRFEDYGGYTSVRDGVEQLLDGVRLSPWRGNVPTIITESRSLAGALRRVVAEYGCRLASTNGQCVGFFHTQVGPELRAGDTVLYFGDWDFSGSHIEANARAVLESIVGKLNWTRLAITEKQVKQYKLTVIQKYDARTKKKSPAVETEALSQRIIVNLLRQHLDKLLPEPLQAVRKRESAERDAVRTLLDKGRAP